MEDFAFEVKEATGDYNRSWVLTKLMTFKLGAKCWAKVVDNKHGAIHPANEPAFNRDLVARDMDKFRGRFSFTVKVEGDDCDAKSNALWIRYRTTAASALEDYPPKARKVAITLDVTSKAKDVTVKAARDGATIVITAPRDKEVAAWSDKIEVAFKKASAKK